MAVDSPPQTNWKDEFDVWSSPVVANILWIILSVPIITAPLAFVGLLASMFYWTDTRRTQIITIFFKTIRKTWHKAFLFFVFNIAVLMFLSFNFLIFEFMDMGNLIAVISRAASFLVLIIFLVGCIPAWIMIAVWDAPLIEIVKFAFKLVFAEPVWMVLTSLSFYFTFAISVVFPSIVLITLTGAVASYFACKGTIHILELYFDRDEFNLIDLT